MNIPLHRLIWETGTPELTRLRNIETRYQIGLIAQNVNEISHLQSNALSMQSSYARNTHHQLTELGYSIGKFSEAFYELLLDVDSINNGVARISDDIIDLQYILDDWLSKISTQLDQQQKSLDDIAATLHHPNEQKYLELLQQAYYQLSTGMKQGGVRRNQWFEDAFDTLQTILDNPIGKSCYIAWFQVGWLYWKLKNNYVDAESAFRRAARLSEPSDPVYSNLSFRHIAYMCYLQNHFSDAWDAISDALNQRSDAETLFDAARYCAKLGNANQSINYIEQSIIIEPVKIISMKYEPDFQLLINDIGKLEERLLTEMKTNTNKLLNNWGISINIYKECCSTCNYHFPLPATVEYQILIAKREQLIDADYLITLLISQKAKEAYFIIKQVTIKNLTDEFNKRVQFLNSLQQSHVNYINSMNATIREEQAKLDSTISSAAYQCKELIKPFLDYWGCISGPLLLLTVLGIPGFLIINIMGMTGTISGEVWYINFMVATMPLLTIWIILYIIYQIKSNSIRTSIYSKVKQTENILLNKHTAMRNEINDEMVRYQVKAKEAETSKRNAENALRISTQKLIDL